MVSWTQDGLLGGIGRSDNSGEGGTLEGATSIPDAGLFASPGTVDAEIITRIQYDTGGSSVNDPLRISGIFTFVSGDFAAPPTPAHTERTATLFLARDDAFAEGEIPTPSQIYGSPGVVVLRYGDGYGGGVTAAGVVGFNIDVPYSVLEINTKYWALLAPTATVPGSPGTPSVANDVPLAPVDTKGRAISFWTNRTPEAPVITSPASGSIVPAGRVVPLSFVPNDPDALPTTITPVTTSPRDVRAWTFSDMSGVQVQYAPRSVGTAEPEWVDLPMMTMDADPVVGRGWYIEYAQGSPNHDSAKQLRDKRSIPLYCGGLDVKPGAAVLPSGNWQLRMRTFDYGHPNATKKVAASPITTFVPGIGPLGMTVLTDITPDTFPEENTSPWSEPVNIAVTSQVPAPLPIRPMNRLAIEEGTPVTLDWQYRNMAATPYDQLQRQVQIRKIGEPNWTTLVSGNQSDESYSIDAPAGNLPDSAGYPEPFEYLPHGGFEAGNTDGWTTSAANGLSVVSKYPYWGEGSALMVNPVTSVFLTQTVSRIIDLYPEHKYVSVSGWSAKDKVLGTDVDEQYILVEFLSGDLTLAFGSFRIFEDEEAEDSTYWTFDDLPIPTGAEKMIVAFVFYSSTGVFGVDTGISIGPLIDDVSVRGSIVTPVSPPIFGELVLPVQDPLPYVLEPTTEYEWRVRVTDETYVTSDWSTPARFWVVPRADSGPTLDVVNSIEGATLGCGTHRVFVYRRGGRVRVGEITQLASVEWNRLRDDMSDAKIVISGWDVDCGNLLSILKTWAYEIVIYRDNGFSSERVWEGPITLPTYENDKVTIDAKDVIAYLYRRIVKEAMNDFGNSDTAGTTVVARAARVVQNVLAADDPNLLAYLTVLARDDDAKQYRSLAPYARTAYEEVDDMAANAGLDYTAIGRRILLWGTKHRIGTLPEFRDEHLGSSPIVSEYGMSMANRYAVSDGNGLYGEATRLDENEEDPDYGLVEMVSSSWASDSATDTGTYTQAGIETIEASFREYAERSIADRYPPPVVVRVPDNTTLNPNAPISIQQLVPGVVIPLRSTGTLRKVTANQKLDAVKVIDTGGKESVSVTMSPFNRDDTSAGGDEV